MIHLVYCDHKADELKKLIRHEKTKLIRGAQGRKLPYGRVNPGEVLYFVENDGKQTIKAIGVVKSVINSPALDPTESEAMIQDHLLESRLSQEQIIQLSGKRYLCIIEVEEVMALDEPFVFERQASMDNWISVEKIEDLTAFHQSSESPGFH